MTKHLIVTLFILFSYQFLEAQQLFIDDFSSDLSKWTMFSDGGSWSIKNGKLIANYDISCGSVGCSQSDIILKDAYQPTGDWKSSVKFNLAKDPNYPNYSAISATFIMYESANKKMYISLGYGGDNLATNLTKISASYGYWNGKWFDQKSSEYNYSWSTANEHIATLEKKGAIYKISINGTLLLEFEDTYLKGSGKLGLHTYGPKIYDDFAITKGGKNLLYLKEGTISDWTTAGVPGSQYKEIKVWEASGYSVTTQKLSTTTLTSSLLSGYEVLRLNTCQAMDRSFTSSETAAIFNWVNSGGKLLADIVCDNNATAVTPFGVSSVTRGPNYSYWTYGGAPLKTTALTGPYLSTGSLAFECMNVATLTSGNSLTVSATYNSKPTVAYGQFGSGKVVISFASGWSHDITWPGNAYRADIGLESNLTFLKNSIEYFKQTPSKNLLYLKNGSPSGWTTANVSGSQYREINEWQAAGYTVTTMDLNITTFSVTLLNNYQVVRIAGSQGAAISTASGNALYTWVNAGGKLFADILWINQVPGVAAFGVQAINGVNGGPPPGADWYYHGSPLLVGPVFGPNGTSQSIAGEAMDRPVLSSGNSLTIDATINSDPVIVHGGFGSGKVVICFLGGWSHDNSWPGNAFQANITQSNNIQFLKNVIGYLSSNSQPTYITFFEPFDGKTLDQTKWEITPIGMTPEPGLNLVVNDTLSIIRGPNNDNNGFYGVTTKVAFNGIVDVTTDLWLDPIAGWQGHKAIFDTPIGSMGYYNFGSYWWVNYFTNAGVQKSIPFNSNGYTPNKKYRFKISKTQTMLTFEWDRGSGFEIVYQTSDFSQYRVNGLPIDKIRILNSDKGFFKVDNITVNYTGSTTAMKQDFALPSLSELFQNYPNPFNPVTTIQYKLEKLHKVSLKVFDLLGKEVATLVNKEQPAGNYQVNFDGSKLTSGVYFYKLQTGNFSQTKKLLLLK